MEQTLTWHVDGIEAKCQFCGGEGSEFPILRLWRNQNKREVEVLYCIGCRKCGTHTLHGHSPEEALENWNNQRYSRDTILLQNSTAEIKNDDGLLLLAERLLRDTYEELKEAYMAMEMRTGRRRELLATIQECRRFIDGFGELTGVSADEVCHKVRKELGIGRKKNVKQASSKLS